MRNYISPGQTLTVAAPHDVNAGDGVIVGEIFGVAFGDADNGADVDLATVGVFDLPKPSAETFAVGARVDWDSLTGEAVSASHSAADKAIGYAVETAGVGATTVRVRLVPTL